MINKINIIFKKNKIHALILILLIFIALNPSIEAVPELYTGSPGTIAHDFLAMEKPFGSNIHHIEFVNRLINKALKKISPKTDYTTEEAIRTLMTIHLLLKEEGFIFKPNFLFNTGIDRKEIDCDTYSALYISISEIIPLPVIPVCAPNHSFVRFNFNDGSYLNWEPIEGKNYPDAYYIINLNISQQSLQEGVYLKALSRKEFIGVEYNNIGVYLLGMKKFQEAIPYFDMAIRLYPKYSSAYHNRGTSYYAIKQTDKAFDDLSYANALDPTQASTHNTLGDIFFDRKEYMKAFDHYAESIKLDPMNYAPYYSLGLLMKNAGKNKEAEEWFKKSAEIKKKYNRQ